MAGRLIVEPVGGLTNRLMAVLSVARIAHRYGMDFGVCWNPTSECGAPFEALFDTAYARFDATNADPDRDVRTIGFGAQGWNVPPVVTRPVTPQDVWIVTHGVLAHEDETREAGFVPGGPIIFDLGRYYRALRPAPAIVAAADAVGLERQRTIGIHIRRPYNAAVALAPGMHDAEQRQYGLLPDAFYAGLVNRLHALNPALTFLLCTNSSATEQYLRIHCDATLITSPKVAADDTSLQSSAIEAAVDTLLLSRTAGLLRHHQSHFAFLSSLTHYQPSLLVVPNGDGTQAALRLNEFGDYGVITSTDAEQSLERVVNPRFNPLLL